MIRNLAVSADAEVDLAKAKDWYDGVREGLGADLVLCVEHALDRILEYPQAFPAVMPGVRRAVVRRFPYGIFFRMNDRRIEVEAIFPLRADPARLADRLHPDS